LDGGVRRKRVEGSSGKELHMRVLVAIGLSLVLVGATRAADVEKAEGTLKELLKEVKNMTAILESIKDNKTADDALPKLEKSADSVKKLGETMKGYKLSPDEQKQLMGKFQKEMQAVFPKLLAASVQAGKNAPDRAKKIQEAMQKAK
jgi:hypothetical protein